MTSDPGPGGHSLESAVMSRCFTVELSFGSPNPSPTIWESESESESTLRRTTVTESREFFLGLGGPAQARGMACDWKPDWEYC